MVAAWLLFFFVQSALTQDQWRLVYDDGSVESVWGAPQLTEEKRAHVQAAWVWSGTHVPQKVDAKSIGEHRCPVDAARLVIRIAGPADARPSPGARVIAAPIAMWRDLPEPLLPHWPAPASGRLAIPQDPAQRWRLRVTGSAEGTWWVDVPPGQTAALLAPVPAKGLRILVTDVQGEPVTPVNGSILEGAARQGANRLWTALRAEDGRFELSALPDLEEVTLAVMKPGYRPAILRGRPSELPDRVQLGTGATLSGRTVDSRGKPVAGAAVEAESWASPEVAQLFRARVRSGADGTWTLAGVTPGTVFLSVRAAGFAPFGQQADAPLGTTDLGTLALTAGREVTVFAVDDEGKAVPGAWIEGPGISAEADAKGIARLAGAAPGAPLKLTASATGHLPGKVQVNPPLPESLRIELPRALTILGRFVETPGVAAADGLLRTEQASCQKELRLDGEGRFELDLPPGEILTVILRSPRTRELRLVMPKGSAGEVRDLGDLVPPPGFTVTGRLVRASDGGSVAGARVWLPRPSQGGPAFAWGGRDLLETPSGEDGQFRLTGLAPGPALLRVEAASFARAYLNLALPDSGSGQGEDTMDIGEVRLAAGSTLRVLVDAPATAPGGAVARADLRGDWSEPDMLIAPVLAGEATLRNVPPGKVTVSVLAGGKLLCEQSVAVPADAATIDVDCARAALMVAGLVNVGGAPAGPGLLLWQLPAAAASSRIDNVVSPGGLRHQTILGAGRPQVDVAVGPDGRFVTDDLTPGRWQVSWVPEAGVVSGSQTIEVPGVERFDTVITYPGLALTGRVVDEDGQPAERARVRELTTGALSFVAADGSFTLAGLGGAKAVLQAQRDELSSDLLEVALEPGRQPEPVLLTLSRRTSAHVKVRVVGPPGSPAAGAFIFLEEEGKGARILSAAADGTVSASFEPPLPVRVRAAATAGNAWALGSWMSWEEAREGITLAFADQGGLRVESEHLEGSPHLVSQGGWDLSWLLRLLGNPFFLSPEQPLRVDGLPPGSYALSLDGMSVTVAVRAGVAVDARLGDIR